MSPVRKRGTSSVRGFAPENDDDDDTVNEDDFRHRMLRDGALGPTAPANHSSSDGEEDEDSCSELVSTRKTGKTDIERRNERNSVNLARLRSGGSPGVPESDSKTLDHKFNRLLTEVNGLRDQIGNRIETLNRRLSQTNRLFLAHQDFSSRSSKAGDLLLVGVPAQEGENLRECFVRIARRLGYAESEIPMVHIKRLAAGFATPSGSSSAPDTAAPPCRPRPTQYNPAVLDNLLRPPHTSLAARTAGGLLKASSGDPSPAVQVQFVFRNARNEFYRRYLERGKAGTCLELRELGYEGPGRVYVNENLTRCNLSLKAEAMRLKRDGKLKSVFTVNGQIYVKRTIDHRPELVTSSVDLLLLDGSKMKANKDCYPRVLEHIINTQPPQVLCRDYKEILGTLDVISTDPACFARGGGEIVEGQKNKSDKQD
uniref:Uncharacterized protein n=1 Tax=Anopheles atroparvus TaxID=41427 RepID=A0A182IPT9_ANOAO